jgi:hypothetical protein
MQKNPHMDVAEVIDALLSGAGDVVEVVGPQPQPLSQQPKPVVVDLTGPPATVSASAPATADEEMERAIQLSLKEHDEREQFNKELQGGRGYK